jgi:phthalate 4,5-cis-dihydrodiol dehydrogenase
MAERMLRLGAIGLGRAASSMLPSLGAHPHAVLAAAADPNPSARARFAADYGGAVFENAEQLCGSGLVDAVYIATPHQRHAENVAVAAAHGLHAIVEKPMALSVDECRAMVASATAAGIALVVGHTHAFDPAILAMRRIIASGELGRLRQLTNLVYTDFLYRPRRSEELDSSMGGGIMYNQVPHQIEIARALDGGAIRSVRAIAGVWDARRRTEGALTALVEFEDGVAAALVYSAYDRFISDEFAFEIGESGNDVSTRVHGSTRRALGTPDPEEEARMKAASGYGGGGVRRTAPGERHQPHFGMLLASCEGGDLRPSADGVLIYDDAGVREIVLPPGRAYPNKDGVIDELYAAVVEGIPPLHDGVWGMRTVEAMSALVRSSAERREIRLAPCDPG